MSSDRCECRRLEILESGEVQCASCGRTLSAKKKAKFDITSSHDVSRVVSADPLPPFSPAPAVSQAEPFLSVSYDRTELYENMRIDELKYQVYNPQAHFVSCRSIIIDWITDVADDDYLSLSTLTVHLAVRYLDRVLGRADVSRSRLQLFAASCIMLAAKFNEQEDRVPPLEYMVTLCRSSFTVDLLRQTELAVLNFLHWSLNVITPLHFVEFFMDSHAGILRADILCSPGFRDHQDKALKYIKKFVQFFSVLQLQDYSMQRWRPSIVACATIACARRAMKFPAIWSWQLAQATGYNEAWIRPCYEELYSYYCKTFPNRDSHAQTHPHPHPPSIQQQKQPQQPQPVTGVSVSGVSGVCGERPVAAVVDAHCPHQTRIPVC